MLLSGACNKTVIAPLYLSRLKECRVRPEPQRIPMHDG